MSNLFNLYKRGIDCLLEAIGEDHHDNEPLASPLGQSSPQKAPPKEQRRDQPQKSEQATSSDAYARKRDILRNIEYTLDTIKREDIHGKFIELASTRINDVHIWLRSSDASTQTSTDGKQAILYYIRNAATSLGAAIIEYSRGGQTAKFFKEIDAGRNALEKAIDCW